ncbi:hypothetical protein PG997_002065 [Apiospora hydei]|uniref:Uncharacterized protein n=1 Tax=Apiospora hydei TaxID=1337664 RepID=A0ABR1X8A8_9PEZI
MSISFILLTDPAGETHTKHSDIHSLPKVKKSARNFLEHCLVRRSNITRTFGCDEYSDENMAPIKEATRDWDVVIEDGISSDAQWAQFLQDRTQELTQQKLENTPVIVRVYFSRPGGGVWPGKSNTTDHNDGEV